MSLFLYYFKTFPKRLARILSFFFKKSTYGYPLWILEWPLLLLDLIALPEILQFLFRMVFWNQRALLQEEETIARSIFKESIYWKIVRLNSSSFIANKMRIAFVSFHTIHFDSKISDDLLIHELVHIWQYQKYGSPYIVRSLYAQHSSEAYDYGGVCELEDRDLLEDFNFEQMGEIIRDAYLDKGQNPVYNKYSKQLLE